jgi:hypothetical protein
MASQVLSGTSNPSYTNNTGQNVRIVINFISGAVTASQNYGSGLLKFETSFNITLNWAGVSVSAPLQAIGRNLAFVSSPGTIEEYRYFEGSLLPTQSLTGFSVSSNNANSLSTRTTLGNTGGNQTQYLFNTPARGSLPTEIMLAPGQTFSAVCGVYNIVIIPEAG